MALHRNARHALCLATALMLPALLAACGGGPPPPMVLTPEPSPDDVVPIAGDSSNAIDATTDAGPMTLRPEDVNKPPAAPAGWKPVPMDTTPSAPPG